jgi:Uma2 family endonuclease
MVTATPERLVRRRFDVDDFDRMCRAGLFDDDDQRLELIDGEVVVVPTPGPPHCGHVDLLAQLLHECCGRRAIVRVQNPFRLDRMNQFQPDLVLLRPDDDFYRSRYPEPRDALLAVEVAASSLYRDRTVKLPHYARTGVPELWIVDLRRACVHVYRGPDGARYRERRRCTGDDAIAVPTDGELTVREVLRPR